MNTTKLKNYRVLAAWNQWNALAPLNFKQAKMRHAIRRNIQFLEPLQKTIQETLQDLRNEQINVDSQGQPKKIYSDKEGKDISFAKAKKEEQLNRWRWDWKKDGQEKAEKSQEEYLEDESEAQFYLFEEKWMDGCYRYLPSPHPQFPAQREEYFVSYAEMKNIEYALREEDEEEEVVEEPAKNGQSKKKKEKAA